MEKKYKILIVAEHASLKFGGEAALPLHYFRVLRQRNIEAWLIVHERTSEELLALFPNECNRIYFIPNTFIHRFLWWCSKHFPRRLANFTFGLLLRLITQVMQRLIIKQIIRERKIDLIHQPIPVSPKEPSIIFDMGIPIIIGPMNGGMKYSNGFQYMEKSFVSRSVAIGRILANILNRLIPGKRKATTLLVANQRTKEALPQGIQGKVIELVENGVDLSVWQQKSQNKILGASKAKAYNSDTETQRPITFVFIGRLIDWKAVNLLIIAFKRVSEQLPVKLEIIGDGDERKALELQAAELGLIPSLSEKHDAQQQAFNKFQNQDWVHFTGWLTQAECAEKLHLADVLVLPSLLECGGAVVLEAMTMGLPVIATNWGGPADYIDRSCGILVEPESRDSFVNNLSNAMLKLAIAPDLRYEMGQAGYQRILQHFDWERKLDTIQEIYQEAIDRYKAIGQK